MTVPAQKANNDRLRCNRVGHFAALATTAEVILSCLTDDEAVPTVYSAPDVAEEVRKWVVEARF